MHEVAGLASQALVGWSHGKKVGKSTLEVWLQDTCAPQIKQISKFIFYLGVVSFFFNLGRIHKTS
jgi:hypothetical protein